MSLIHKHTNTIQANLFDINIHDASKILDMTSWVPNHIYKNQSCILAILAASTQSRFQRLSKRGVVEDENVVKKKIRTRSWIQSQALQSLQS